MYQDPNNLKKIWIKNLNTLSSSQFRHACSQFWKLIILRVIVDCTSGCSGLLDNFVRNFWAVRKKNILGIYNHGHRFYMKN